jgi:hypothetical protein
VDPERDSARVTTPERSSETWTWNPSPDYTDEPIPIGTALAEVVALLGQAVTKLRHAGLRAERLALQPEIDTLAHLQAAWSMRLAPGHEHDSWNADVRRSQETADAEAGAAFDDQAVDDDWLPRQAPERRRAFVAATARTCAGNFELLASLAEMFIGLLNYDEATVEAGIADALRAVAA